MLPGLTPVPAIGVPPVPPAAAVGPLAPVRSLSPSGPPSPSPSPGVSPLGTPRYKSVDCFFFFFTITALTVVHLLFRFVYLGV